MKKLFYFLACIIALLISCSKEKVQYPQSPVVKKELTLEEKKMKDKLALTAQVVRDVVMSSKDVVNEVNSLIRLNLHNDDFIYFKELLDPENSVFKAKNVSSKSFANAFETILSSKGISPDFRNLKEFVVANNVAIYCPYPDDEYPAGSDVIALSSDPIDNEYENIGYEIEEDGSYSEVLVDDNYAETTKVWIITQEDELGAPAPIINNSNNVHQMRVGWVKCTKQYDGLFGGGSEFKFCILGGDITMTSATTFVGLQTCNLSRYNIRKKKWVSFQYELDDDWYVSSDGTTDEGSRQFGLIEFDKNKKEFTLSFEPKVKIGTVDISAGKISLTLQSNEGWIKLDNYQSRDNFIKFNKSDMGQGLQDGYRVYTAGDVYWTLPIKEY